VDPDVTFKPAMSNPRLSGRMPPKAKVLCDPVSQCCQMLVGKPAQCPHKTSPKPAPKAPN